MWQNVPRRRWTSRFMDRHAEHFRQRVGFPPDFITIKHDHRAFFSVHQLPRVFRSSKNEAICATSLRMKAPLAMLKEVSCAAELGARRSPGAWAKLMAVEGCRVRGHRGQCSEFIIGQGAYPKHSRPKALASLM
jgi:hypothetical protein